MKNLIKKALTGIMILTPALTFAQELPFGVKTTQTNIRSLTDIERVIGNIVTKIITLFYVAAILYVFYAAYLFLTSSGDPEKVKEAKNQLLYSVIAIAVALLAGTMKNIVVSILA